MSEPSTQYYDEALALARAGRMADAAAMLQVVLQAGPDDAAAWALLTAVRQRLGQAEAALACAREVVRLTPEDVGAHLTHGNLLASLGHPAEALASFDLAVRLAPGLAFAHNNRANVLNRLGRSDEALAAADQALALDPSLAHAWRHRGLALLCLADTAGSIAAYRRALESGDGQARFDVLCDLSGALAAEGRYDEAVAILDEAMTLRPDDAAVLMHRAEIRLVTGDFERGWSDYEARWRLTEVRRGARELTPELFARLIHAPRAEDLAGRRVLVVGEQGPGDVIMYASVLPDLARIAGQVTCTVETRLVKLLAGSLPEVTFTPYGGANVDAAAFDRVVALASLPLMFRREAAAFPRRPYLVSPHAVVDGWRRRLDGSGPRRRLRVGLSWRGGLQLTRAMARSLPLGDLVAGIDRDDCAFVSLQYGDVADEVATVNRGRSNPVLAFPAEDIDDFGALAGLVQALDVVVTVQTTLAHLTGALGVPGLVMLTRWPEWRYGLTGEDMAWYGSLRLLRQTVAGDWSPVLADVGRRLDALNANERVALNEKTPRGGGAS